ncbi:TrkA C-terminal domain-containing protein [Jannaschia aquimarina]|uniref:TrkA-C domain protein n=1 Tax=Jannaschia aquimarina TaxID=935700 RepID=A0A0D1EBW8_9RHOB|nr:TrkA C-terminal domain-containing protein [Jannaschia aquimarina]KIT15224.1 TrkA-C domain protein [Jannaschia aquimarina]SNT32671.1 TrkA-C domain-containing protein [Jannaschia aquimarina]
MIAILSVLSVLTLSFVIVRVGAIALTMTGISDDVARFQALSAFSGAGFTTGESENVVNGPARRRIVAWLIRLGSAGVVTVISTLMLSFVGESYPTWEKLLVLFAGLAVLIALARSDRLDRVSRPLIQRLLRNSATLELRDYAGLLHLREDWRVSEAEIGPTSPLLAGTLSQLGLHERGILVLGIERADGSFEGAPGARAQLAEGDVAILYGQTEKLLEVARPPAPSGDPEPDAVGNGEDHGDGRQP